MPGVGPREDREAQWPELSILKSPAITAVSSRTRLTARLSGTNQSWINGSISASSSGAGMYIRCAEVMRAPGISASQSSGNTSHAAGSKGRDSPLSMKAV
jgi:hypothetical protein